LDYSDLNCHIPDPVRIPTNSIRIVSLMNYESF